MTRAGRAPLHHTRRSRYIFRCHGLSTRETTIATAEKALNDGAPAQFPIRVAALDVGSNAIRFAAAEFNDVESYTVLDSLRFAVRLGHDAFTTRSLSPDTLDAAVAAAVRFRQRLDDLGISHYRAVATSAVRESRNGGELVDRIRSESGIHLETITGTEEARLVWLAVHRRVLLDRRPWLLADLGGGSIELSIIDREGIRWSQSHPMGTVRMLEDLAGEEVDAASFRDLVARYAARLSLPEGSEREVEGIVITGGNAEALADLAQATIGAAGVSEMSRATLRSILDRLTAMSFRERIEKLGMREDRADVIVPAAIIFDRVAEIGGTERILVPRVGVRDGLLFDQVADYAQHGEHEGEIDRATLAGSIALGRRYRFDEAHARHVADLALALFDQLAPLHGLGESSRRRLAAGALLHDIGQFISYRRHHKHSWYLVANSDLPGLTDDDTRVIALVTRYHRRSEPRDVHEEFGALKDAEKIEVRKLAAILRVADALDREHRRRVRSVRATVKNARVVLHLDVAGHAALEEWAVRKKGPLFERVFGVKLQVA